MASTVDICNGALNQLGASTILTLTEDSKNARLCNARSPPRANNSNTTVAMKTPRSAQLRRWRASYVPVSTAKIAAASSGPIVAKKVAKAMLAVSIKVVCVSVAGPSVALGYHYFSKYSFNAGNAARRLRKSSVFSISTRVSSIAISVPRAGLPEVASTSPQ